MGFRCPGCGGNGLAIGRSIELGADARSDEITLQLLGCTACGLRAIAVYQESRRGSLDAECVEHAGFRVPSSLLEHLDRLLASCPRPRDSGCTCAAHRELQRCDASGEWNPAVRREFGGSFAMQFEP